jgi:hypothetical protein
MAGLASYRFVLGEGLALGKRVRDIGVMGAAVLASTVLTVLPYLAVQREMGLRRSLDGGEWAVPAWNFLASPTHVHAGVLKLFSATWINQDALAWLFPGYVPLLLAAAAIAAPALGVAVGSSERRRTGWTRLAAGVEILALISAAAAVAAALVGPFRWRVGDTLIFSMRHPLRAWTILLLLLLVRWSLRPRAPLAFAVRLRASRDGVRRWAEARRRDSRTYYALLTLLGVWLAAGPPIGLWPAVYWLPGLSFIRVASRFTLMAMLGLAVLAGLGFERLTAKLSVSTSRITAAITAMLLLTEFALVPMATTPYRIEIPAIDRWLAGKPTPFSIAEVPLPPLGAGGAWERRQTEYMIHSMAHWQKTVHGYSGLRPPLHQELFNQLRLFPDSQSLTTLARLGVDYVVVHGELYPPGEWPHIERRLQEFSDRLRLEHVEGEGRVYRLTAID